MNEQFVFSKLSNLQPKQLDAWYGLLNPAYKYLLYGGSMAGGKSYLLRWAAVGLSMYYYKKYGVKNVPIGLFSEDYPTLKDRQISRIEREFPKWMGKLKEDKTFGLAFHLESEYGNGRILLRNLDDPSKYMSSEFAGIFVEELTRNDQQTFEDLRNRLRYPGIEEVKFMGATNPGGVGHAWVRKKFIDGDPDDPERDRFFYIHANAYDNQYISKDYIKQLESLPPQKRKAYLEGSWDVFEGQYFSEFSRNKHVIEPFIPDKTKFDAIIGGLDWGSAAPFGFQLTGLKHKKTEEGIPYTRAYTFCELYGTDKRPAEWGELIIKQLDRFNLKITDVNYIMADNSIFNKGQDMGKSIYDQFCDASSSYRGKLRPSTKDRIAGWTNIHNWLSDGPDGVPYWLMTENCKNLIRTLPTLIHDDLKIEDVDSDGDDHMGDSVRYMFHSVKWQNAKLGAMNRGKPQKAFEVVRNGNFISVDTNKFLSKIK